MSHNALNKNLSTIGKLAVGITCLTLAGLASAGSGDPLLASVDPLFTINTSGDLIPTAGGSNDGSNDFSFSGSKTWAGQYSVNWNLNVNPDPFIDGSFTITNLTGSAKDFTVNLLLPVTPAFSSGLMGGSINATVFDRNNSGSATLRPQSDVSNPIYFGQIDGSDVLLMFAQQVGCISTGCIGSSGESEMPPSIPVAGVNTSIGTRLAFNLSAGDKVTFSTHFEVTPVPVPAAAWLMGSALLGLVGVRRRS